MDFMNLNQAAHGDREHGFIGARMRLPRKIIAGYWQDAPFQQSWLPGCGPLSANAFSHELRVIRFGDNMRDVAVTEGDKVETQIKLGWQSGLLARGPSGGDHGRRHRRGDRRPDGAVPGTL